MSKRTPTLTTPISLEDEDDEEDVKEIHNIDHSQPQNPQQQIHDKDQNFSTKFSLSLNDEQGVPEDMDHRLANVSTTSRGRKRKKKPLKKKSKQVEEEDAKETKDRNFELVKEEDDEMEIHKDRNIIQVAEEEDDAIEIHKDRNLIPVGEEEDDAIEIHKDRNFIPVGEEEDDGIEIHKDRNFIPVGEEEDDAIEIHKDRNLIPVAEEEDDAIQIHKDRNWIPVGEEEDDAIEIHKDRNFISVGEEEDDEIEIHKNRNFIPVGEEEDEKETDKDRNFVPMEEEKSAELEGDLGGNEEEAEKERKAGGEKPIEEGTSLSPPLHYPPDDEGLVVLGLVLDDQLTTPSVARRPSKIKKLTVKQREAAEKKFTLVRSNLQPIPFVPEKNLDFSKHEELFRRLGLWDFVNMKFDQDIRADLLARLIANYSSIKRCSIVNDCRINVSRADLARALKLQVKKDKNAMLESSGLDSEPLSDESISVVNEFLDSWILLHDDTWILPKEVLNWEDLIKKGQPHLVDWPGLLWFMVEKELKQDPQIGTLYYASHIQCLMKSQKSELFTQEPRVEVSIDGDEGAFDSNMGRSEDHQEQELEKQQTELCLGQHLNGTEQQCREVYGVDQQECKQKQKGPIEWCFDGSSCMNEHSLRHCNLNDAHILVSEDIQEEDEQGYNPQSQSTSGGLATTTVLPDIGTAEITYGAQFRLRGNSSVGIFQSGVDAQFGTGGPSMFSDHYRRELGLNDSAENHAFSGHHKRVRSPVSPPDYDSCMEQVNIWNQKAGVRYQEKEEACMNSAHVVSDLQQQNNTLNTNLHKVQIELQMKDVELQRKDVVIYNLEHELELMSNLLEGYRNAIKQSRQTFSEYRKRNPEPIVPLYMDAGPGGHVISVREFERQQLEQEKQEKMFQFTMEHLLKDFDCYCLEKLEQFDKRIEECMKNIRIIKEKDAGDKKAEMGEEDVGEKKAEMGEEDAEDKKTEMVVNDAEDKRAENTVNDV